MSGTEIELGPVDYIVIEFPGSKFNGKVAPELVSLVNRGIIRLLDLVFIHKDADGNTEVLEAAEVDADEAGPLVLLQAGLVGLAGTDDIDAAAAILEPGSSAALIVYENTWAAPFATAVRQSGGVLVDSGRIPATDLIAAFEDLELES
jgi:hypothetical protein